MSDLLSAITRPVVSLSQRPVRQLGLLAASVLFGAMTVGSVVATAPQSTANAENKKAVFVLVHGAFQDASGLNQVKKNLEAQGETAILVEWAGRGGDKTPFKDITMDMYRDAVIDVIKKQDQPVILVAHSFGGMVMSTAAETVPNRIKKLVYLSAYLPRNGDSLLTLSAMDKYSILNQPGNFIVAAD